MNSASTQSFPGADTGSDHDLLMITFHFVWKESASQKLKDSSVLETIQVTIGGKLAPLTIINNEDADMESVVTTFNTAMTETASKILGKHRQKKKKKNLGNCINSWSVRQKESTEKEKIRTWMI